MEESTEPVPPHDPLGRVGAENLCTSRDLGVLGDQPTETIVPQNLHMSLWSGRWDGPQRWYLTE
jgi:hypothetical protein